jgi:hypothetical protein
MSNLYYICKLSHSFSKMCYRNLGTGLSDFKRHSFVINIKHSSGAVHLN